MKQPQGAKRLALRNIGTRRGARVASVALVALVFAACQTTSTRRPGDSLSPQAFFWEAKAPDGGMLFLLGSVHIGDGRELALDPRIEKDWRAAQELVVELDITSLSPVDAVEAMNRHGLLPEPQMLRQVVRAETYKQVAQYMKTREYSMDRVDQMRPWMVALVVQELEYSAVGLRPENGVDAVLLRRAKGQRPIVALETLDQQMGAFASLPDAIQETWLVDMLGESEALLGYTRELLRAWETGDEAKLMAAFFPAGDASPDQAQFYDRMYWSRNQAMADQLAGLAADGKPRFVVVGTGHLLGPRGIPELLSQRGFKVSRAGSARVLGGTLHAPDAATAPAAAGPVASDAPPPKASAVAPATTSIAPPPTSSAPPSSAASAVATPKPSAQPPATAPAASSAVSEPRPAPPLLNPVEGIPAAPLAAPVPGRDVHDQWLGQDAGSARATNQPEAAPPVAPKPATAVTAKPAPKTPVKAAAKAKPKTKPAVATKRKR